MVLEFILTINILYYKLQVGIAGHRNINPYYKYFSLFLITVQSEMISKVNRFPSSEQYI